MAVEGSSPETIVSPASTETASQVVADPASSDAKPPAQSSSAPAADAKEAPVDLKTILTRVVAKSREEGQSSEAEGKTPAEPEAETKPEGEAKADDKDDVPFHKHPRWQAMLTENRELKPDAEEFRTIRKYMADHGLSTEEAADGFATMAQLKNDSEKALARLGPIVDSLRETLGETLPKDLREKVDAGQLDDDSAKELAKARGKSALADAKAKEAGDRKVDADKAAAATALQNTLVGAVNAWEGEVKGRDPDFAKKVEDVLTTAQALMLKHGMPRTAEDAKLLVDTAYRRVNERWKAIIPPKPAIRRGPTSSVASSTTASAAPTTMREAMEAGLRKSRAA